MHALQKRAFERNKQVFFKWISKGEKTSPVPEEVVAFYVEYLAAHC
jgi:hypothetical protein